MKLIAQRFLRLVEVICIICLIMIALVIGLQIFCRTFSIGISWTEEFARLIFCLMVFVSAPMALAEGIDIAVDLVINLLHGKLRSGAEIVISIVIGIFSIFCIRSGFANLVAYENVAAVSMAWLQMNWLYTAIMISFAALLIVCAVRVICVVRGRPLTLVILPKAPADTEDVKI